MGELNVGVSLEVNATAAECWKWLADVGSWPSWKGFIISSSYTSGANLEKGAKLQFKPNAGPIPMNLKAIISESKAPNFVMWEGKMPMISGFHSFEFENLPGGKCRVSSKEKFTGPALPIFKLVMPPKKLEALHVEWVEAFKKRAAKK